MASTKTYPLEIFYDGSCVVCSYEMEGYRRRNPEQRLVFVDISAKDFNAEKYGLSYEQFMEALQVRDADGRFHSGVDAFLLLWAAFPDDSLYRLFGTLISFPGVRFAAGIGYILFARFRHLLPKRRGGNHAGSCDTGACHLKHPRSGDGKH